MNGERYYDMQIELQRQIDELERLHRDDEKQAALRAKRHNRENRAHQQQASCK